MLKKKYYLNYNYILAKVISQLTVGLRRKLRAVRVSKTYFIIRLLWILYKEGIIRTFRIESDYIVVYFKYKYGQPIGKFSIISRPGRRQHWTLERLSKSFSNSNFSGFYIVSTSAGGLVTSNYCLLGGHQGGQVIVKVEI